MPEQAAVMGLSGLHSVEMYAKALRASLARA